MPSSAARAVTAASVLAVLLPLSAQAQFVATPIRYTNLPADLTAANLHFVQVPKVNLTVGVGNSTNPSLDGEIINLWFTNIPTGGAQAVSNRAIYPGEAVCSVFELPSGNYRGLSPSFYVLEGFNTTVNNGTQDEMDVEFLGSTTNWQINYFNLGDGTHETKTQMQNTSQTIYDFCLYNNHTELIWYLNGTVIFRREATLLNPMFPRFALWDTTGKWDCCGAVEKDAFELIIHEFGVFSPDPNVILTTTTTTTTTKMRTTATGAPKTTKFVTTTKTSAAKAALGKKGAVVGYGGLLEAMAVMITSLLLFVVV
ncbi:hypothetical protein HK101_010067 [Irineochytrium annulatum]|nr:hypothetical protein HK101_010067 [Irineochytrium annulatum]